MEIKHSRQYHPKPCYGCVERIFGGALVYNSRARRRISPAQKRFIIRSRIETLREGRQAYWNNFESWMRRQLRELMGRLD